MKVIYYLFGYDGALLWGVKHGRPGTQIVADVVDGDAAKDVCYIYNRFASAPAWMHLVMRLIKRIRSRKIDRLNERQLKLIRKLRGNR